MKIKKTLGVLFRTALSFILLFATAAAAARMMKPKEIPRNRKPNNMTTSVETVPIIRHNSELNFDVDGEVIPYRNIKIVPEISGRVVYKSDNCRPGRSVQKGELLLEIDPIDYELAVREKTEALATAQANEKENNVSLENTQNELKIAREQLEIREKELSRYEASQLPGAYSQSEIDTVNMSLLTTREAVIQLESKVTLYTAQQDRLASLRRAAEVNLDTAKLNLERTKITSPITGVVTSDTFEMNSYLQKGTSIADILDTSRLEIQCSLQMKQIKWIWLSGVDDSENRSEENISEEKTSGAGSLMSGYVFKPVPVTILYELEGDTWSWEGMLQTLDGSGINAATRMVPCRVTVDHPQNVELLTARIESSRPADSSNLDELRKKYVNESSPTVAPPTLLAGMYVTVVVHTKPQFNLYRIPEKALLPGNRIWTAKDGILHRYDLTVATATHKGVYFYGSPAGPFENDPVVVSPMASPLEGEKVHLVGSPEPAGGEKPDSPNEPVPSNKPAPLNEQAPPKEPAPLSGTAPSNIPAEGGNPQ